MRLQLTLALMLAARSAGAEGQASVDVRSGVYQDSDRTFISTTTVAARGIVKDRLTIEARYLVDVVSSASVDVVTAATSRFSETRHEAAGAVGYRDGTNAVSGGYIYSIENDWESHTANLGWSRDLAKHNVTIGLGGTFVYNAVGRSGDRNFHRTLVVGGGAAFVSFTPTPRDVVSINYSTSYLTGYQASPYRFVYFTDGPSRASVPETDPNTRFRHALTLRWNRHVFTDSAIQSFVRGYVDDWGVTSATVGAEYLIGLHDFTLGLHVRGYFQEHASFYRPVYTAPLRYMTADRELSRFVDGFAGVRLGWRRQRLGRLTELRAEAKVDAFGFWFFDFPRLQSRSGVVVELALGASF